MKPSIGYPAHWVVARLQELLREPLRNGHSAPESKNGEGIRTLTLTAVTLNELSEKNTKITTADPARVRDLWLKDGDILIERSNTPELVGTASLYTGSDDFAIFPDLLIRVRLTAEVDVRFYAYFLRSTTARSYFQRSAQGIAGSMPKISQRTIEDLPVPVSPPREQHRIVEAIESYFTRLDDAVATLERVQRNLKRYRTSVLKAAVEGRLVPTEAELARAEGRDYEPASVLLERILAERRRASQSGEDLPAVPEGWTWATLGELAEVMGGITKGQKPRPGARYREVPYLRVANVQRGYLDLSVIKTILASEDHIAQLRLEPGDVLFNEGGDRDKLGRGWVWKGEISECIHQNHVFRARIIGKSIVPELLSWYGNTEGQRYFYEEGKHTTNLASINMTKLRALPVPVPPRAEQLRILEAVETKLSIVDEALRTVERERMRCDRLRQSILKWAFEGRLVDQDPSDEPASALLERIKAERAATTTTSNRKPRRKGNSANV